jgi:trehalose 6-phosphate phosphatase
MSEASETIEDLRLRSSDALLLDFDGTLADLVVDPGHAAAPASTLADLRALARLLAGAVAVISGRALEDLAGRTPDQVWRIGSHGLELRGPGPASSTTARPELGEGRALISALEARVRERLPGVLIERKPFGFAAHSRAAPHLHEPLVELLSQALAGAGAWRMQHGKLVVDVLPARAEKGHAVRELLEHPTFHGRRPLMLGDDQTDESAMAAVLEREGAAVKVGPGPSVADHRAEDPEQVRWWLARERTALEKGDR